MLIVGNLGVTPRLNGMEFMDKPPLVYWVQAVFYEAFGRHDQFGPDASVPLGKGHVDSHQQWQVGDVFPAVPPPRVPR